MAPNHELLDIVDAEGGDPAARSLALAHGCACTGRWEALAILCHGALERGRTAADLVEMGLQVVAYAGFPRAIEALGIVRDVLERAPEAAAEGIEPTADGEPDGAEALARAGHEVFEDIYREATPEVLAGLDALCAGFSRWVLMDAYGRILSRPGLSLADRERMAVSALALMALPAPLGSHIRGALRNGSTCADVEDILRSSRALADGHRDPTPTPTVTASEGSTRSPHDVIDQALDRLSRKVYQR